MDVMTQLKPQLKHLRLSGILETLDVRNRQAVDDKWSYIEFLSRLLEDECFCQAKGASKDHEKARH